MPLLEPAAPANADIRIVGLGPGALEDLTLAAWQALTSAARVVARTRRHPCLAQLAESVPIESFDDLYEQHEEVLGNIPLRPKTTGASVTIDGEIIWCYGGPDF